MACAQEGGCEGAVSNSSRNKACITDSELWDNTNREGFRVLVENMQEIIHF